MSAGNRNNDGTGGKMSQSTQISPVKQAIEIAINLSLIFIILAWCLQILRPFVLLLIWGAVIAISVYRPFLKLKDTLGGSNKLAAIVVTLIGLALVIVPAWMFAGSLVESAKSFSHSAASGSFSIPPPAENIRNWPLIGEPVYTAWSEASSNLQSWLERHGDQMHEVVQVMLAKILNLGASLLQLIVSTIVAGALLANAEATKTALLRFCRRLIGERGEEMLITASATIRSVAVGVLGIAFIQAVMGGAGVLLVGVPAAGVWTLLILVLAIAQLPPLLALLPAIFYVFSVETTTVAIAFTVWSIIVSFSDAVLKPLLLGRGVDTPMLVILLGAIGGMITSGIIGLFVGAVVLTLGYKLILVWLQSGGPDAAVTSADDQPSGE